jgi:hypothetical protein
VNAAPGDEIVEEEEKAGAKPRRRRCVCNVMITGRVANFSLLVHEGY